MSLKTQSLKKKYHLDATIQYTKKCFMLKIVFFAPPLNTIRFKQEYFFH